MKIVIAVKLTEKVTKRRVKKRKIARRSNFVEIENISDKQTQKPAEIYRFLLFIAF